MKKKWLWVGIAGAVAIVAAIAIVAGLWVSAVRSHRLQSHAPVTVVGTTRHASPAYEELQATDDATLAPADGSEISKADSGETTWIARSSNSSRPARIPSMVGLTSISGMMPTRWVGHLSG